MFHLFKIDEDHQPTLLGVLIALALAIPFCLVWAALLAINHKPASSVATLFSTPDPANRIAGKLA